MVKKISNQIDNLLYLSVFTINSLIIFLFHFFVAKQSILQWGNVSNIPVIQKLRDNNFLPTDDYLAGATDSPNYIFAKLVDYLSVINQDMFTTLFFLKLFYIFFIPMLLMKLCFVLVERFKFIYSYTVEQVNFQKIMIFLMILFLANHICLWAWHSFQYLIPEIK
jgi:hypothetical protein